MASRSRHSAPRNAPAPRALWSGTISFGLVNIPVKLVQGVRRKDVHFHLLHEKDNARLQRKYVCPIDEKEVPKEEIKRGFQIAPDQLILIEDEELEALSPKASRTIELLYFVDRAEIDPVYFDVPYYLLPDERSAKAYQLLLQALKTTRKAAISKFVLRNKEYIAMVRPTGPALCLETMRFPDEVVFAEDLSWKPPSVKISERELKTAQSLIESLAGKFEPNKLHDDYREAVLDLVKKKAEGQKIVTQAAVPANEPEVIDLMAALQKSLHEAKSNKVRKTA
jgi:DNA end-binding protein Ku